MALNIITSDQALQVSSIITYIYADPGLGKSSLGFTAHNAISFDFDKGSHRTGELRRGAVVQVQKWTDVSNLSAQDLAPFNTVVIDTVGAMLETIKAHLQANAVNRQKDGALKLKAQGLANNIFKQFITSLVSMGKDIVFIAHASEDNSGDQVIYRPELGGKNRNELYRMADIMGYLTKVRTEEGKSERLLSFNPSDTYHAKNSGALGNENGEVWIPDLKTSPTFLADLIQQAKDHINTLTPEQIATQKAMADWQNWQQSCDEAKHAGDLNELTVFIKSVEDTHMFYHNMRAYMAKKAKELKCSYNKEKQYWMNPPEFNALSDAQRDEIQDLLAEQNIDVQTFCEDMGIDSLIAIPKEQFEAVKKEIINKKSVEDISQEEPKPLAMRITEAVDLQDIELLQKEVDQADPMIKEQLQAHIDVRTEQLKEEAQTA